MDVDDFARVYQSVERVRARDRMSLLSLMQNAFHGDKKSFKAFVEGTKEWLPKQERDAGKRSAEELAGAFGR